MVLHRRSPEPKQRVPAFLSAFTPVDCIVGAGMCPPQVSRPPDFRSYHIQRKSQGRTYVSARPVPRPYCIFAFAGNRLACFRMFGARPAWKHQNPWQLLTISYTFHTHKRRDYSRLSLLFQPHFKGHILCVPAVVHLLIIIRIRLYAVRNADGHHAAMLRRIIAQRLRI